MQLLRNPGWLLGCCNAVARVPGVVAISCYGTRGGCLRCCYVVAMVPRVVAKVLLCSC